MSRYVRSIEVTPPEHSCVESEKIVLIGFDCPNCFGHGEFADFDTREGKTRSCAKCGGTGSVKAVVKILWEPDLTKVKYEEE